MASLISWLDASTEENSKMRELVKLFGTPETTDDLGMGRLRDVISNSLFPGTSVLHLGARYTSLTRMKLELVGHDKPLPAALARAARNLQAPK